MRVTPRRQTAREFFEAAIFTLSKTHGGTSSVGSAPKRQGLPLQVLDLGLQLGDALTLPHMLR
jgi:hypothetical protein